MEQELSPLDMRRAMEDCEALWRHTNPREEARRLFAQAYAGFSAQVMALDDDPTGTQTVHDVDVLTSWDEESLAQALAGEKRLFFVLTNSRSFSAEKTEAVHREIAQNALRAARRAGKELLVISRGDSTLRGHYPLETAVLRDTFAQESGAPFAGEVLCPFFREGGRFTMDGVHYVKEGETLVPAAQTEFAADATFGYRHSYLPEYIEEKSGGRVRASQVYCITCKQLRSFALDEMVQSLEALEGYRYIVADAVEEADVQLLAVVLMRLFARGKRYLLRTAAAVPKVFGNISDRPQLRRDEMTDTSSSAGGLVLVGSHVKKTTAQLEELRQSEAPLTFMEFHADLWNRQGALEAETARTTALAQEAMAAGRTAVVYTSRRAIVPQGMSAEELLDISVRISDALTGVVAQLALRPRFLIAKGGITSSDVGVKALRVRKARVLGQAQPGVPVWKTGAESRFPGLSYIIFPGNVGNVGTLRAIVEELA